MGDFFNQKHNEMENDDWLKKAQEQMQSTNYWLQKKRDQISNDDWFNQRNNEFEIRRRTHENHFTTVQTIFFVFGGIISAAVICVLAYGLFNICYAMIKGQPYRRRNYGQSKYNVYFLFFNFIDLVT